MLDHPFTGLAGDMLLGALIGAGAPLDAVRASVAATGLTGWELTAEPVVTHGLAATRAVVRVSDTATARSAAEVIALAARAEPAPVAAVATAALRAIAETEGRLHGEDPARVHLHELGGHDAVVDIVGVAAALHALGATAVHCAPLPLGTGSVRTRHGLLPVPAPATAALLARAGATVAGSDLAGETVTPTGAALLLALEARYDPPPEMTLTATGYGTGTRVLPDRPNVVAVTLGREPDGPAAETLHLLETNLDDVTGELLGHVIARALAQGALDAWVTPATMKKGRPAAVLHVLCRPEAETAVRDLVLAETGALGVRRTTVRRTALPRHTTEVDLDGHRVRVKHGPYAAKPEHDDLVAAATALGIPLREAAERARRLASPQPHQDGSPP
ncbi:nickel pincer cofactor biosynthesis protein LarC [Thermocatellispora tengchongensis]|uniref:nickel pincer cofactor biosynthesis protein LarC n=1 Tax=Thermocatellispora tengchongensis TaxID=1073253 RepID=UPI0036350EE6